MPVHEENSLVLETASASRLGERLAESDYLRQRISPRLRDATYLSFSDLAKVVSDFAASANGTLFDYGCGGSPYREWFRGCDRYIRADVTPGPNIDRVLSPSGETDEADDSIERILSAQVLEHVRDPDFYIDECRRILKPGGELLLSTHGMFHEHGCPHDYYRWTAAGLEELIRSKGFKVVASWKLTTGVRAFFQVQHYFMDQLRPSERPLVRYPFAVWKRVYRRLGIPLLNWLGDRFALQGAVPGSDPACFYVGVCVRAQKPLQ